MEKFSFRTFILSVLLVFIAVSLLLIQKVINETIFGAILVGYLLVAFFLYKKDEIVELKTNLFEMRTLKKDIYAKADEVEKLQRQVAKTEAGTKNIKVEIQQLTRQLIRFVWMILLLTARPKSEKRKNKLKIEMAILLDKSFDDKEELKKFGKNLEKDIGDG